MTLADKIVVLKDGEVMQVGAPMELFNYPKNKFVAGFLGSPKMNFFEGKLVEVNSAETSGKVEFDGHTSNHIRLVSTEKRSAETVQVGIRPQDLKIKNDGAISGKVTIVERLGTETVVELVSKSEVPFRFASPDTLDLKVGSQVSFTYDRKKAHIF
jgi:multiple sugar transport system ATP-binding protein